MAQTAQKSVRFTPGQWKRVEKESERREKPPGRLVVKPAMEVLEHRE